MPADEIPDDLELPEEEPAVDAWEESKHPRKDNGQFGTGSGEHKKTRSNFLKNNSQQQEKYIFTARGKKAEVINACPDDIFREKLKKARVTRVNPVSDRTIAEERLKQLANNDLKNEEQNITAQINRNQREKMLSNKSYLESIKNGFTKEDHFGAAANIKELFRNAIFRLERKDEDNDPNVMSISRFISPVLVNGIKAYAKITVKKVKNSESRKIYTIELHSLTQVEEGNAGLDVLE